RADRLGLLAALRDLHTAEGIADPHGHADQTLEVVGEPFEMRRAAREHDLADAQRAGLVLVELERSDELAGKGLHLPPHRLPCRRRLVFAESFGRRPAAERERALDRLRL